MKRHLDWAGQEQRLISSHTRYFCWPKAAPSGLLWFAIGCTFGQGDWEDMSRLPSLHWLTLTLLL